MLNRIWFWLLFVGIAYGFGKSVYVASVGPPAQGVEAAEADGPPPNALRDAGERLTEAALDAASVSVELCLGLAGVMILWMGILQVAKDAGMVDALARALRPVMRWLFPEVPDGHPAQGAMLMNMSANMLGLDNAATPFGLKAMDELQKLNPQKDVASNSMATFLAINTSSVTLVPISVIALRQAAGSEQSAAPLFGILLATAASTIAAVVAVRALSRLPRFAGETSTPLDPPLESPSDEDSAADTQAADTQEGDTQEGDTQEGDTQEGDA